MTLGDMITDVRKLVNDTEVEYRWSDNDIAGYLRDAVERLRVVRQVARFNDDGTVDTREYPAGGDLPSHTLSKICSRWRQAFIYYAAARCIEIDAADTVNQALAVDFMAKAEARFAT